MKHLTSLVFVGMFSLFGYSQEKMPQNYSDSLSYAKELINKLEHNTLIKQHEHFLFLSRTTSYKLYDEIFAYIDERIKMEKK